MVRKVRSDKGEVRLTDRDLFASRWTGEQIAVRLDTLQKLLGRYAQQETKVEGQVTESAARRVVERWERERLAASRKFFFKGPRSVWLTARGLREVGLTFKPHAPTLSMLNHMHNVNEARLLIERKYGDTVQWRGERALRQAHRNDTGFHVPDAEVRLKLGVIAVEVELTQKSYARIEAIVERLDAQYAGVWYFVNATTKPLIERVRKTMQRAYFKFTRSSASLSSNL